MRRSKKAYAMGVGIETAFNTYKAPTNFIRYLKSGLNVTANDEDLDICDGTPGSTYIYRKDAEIGGTTEVPAWPEGGLEQLLKLIFGKATSTINGTGTSYTHLFEQDWSSVLSASITQWIPGFGAGDEEVEAYTGAVLSALEIGYDGPGPISLKATWDCGGYDASKSAPARTYTEAPIFVWGNLVGEIDGVAKSDITKASLKIERSVDKLHGATGDPVTALLPNIMTPTDWKVTGSLAFPVENRDYMMEYISGSSAGTTLDTIIKDKTLQLTCTGPIIHDTYAYLMDFKMPLVNMTKCEYDKDDDNTIQYDIDYAARRYEGVDAGLGTDCILTGEVVSELTSIL